MRLVVWLIICKSRVGQCLLGARMAEFATFISYAREDRFVADRIAKELRRHGLAAFQDLKSIEPGSDFRAEIRDALQKTRTVVLLLSSHAVKSSEVLKEIRLAKDLGIPILPVMLDEQALDAPNPLADLLHDLQRIYVDAKNKTAGDITPVIRAVRRRCTPTAPVIAFSNLKGGVGKTTLAAHLSSCLSSLGRLSILMIDMDPQANLSQFVLPQGRFEELIEQDQSVLSLFETSLVYGSPSPRRELLSVAMKHIDKPMIMDICSEVEFSEFAKLSHGNQRKPVFVVPGQFELVKYTLPKNANALDLLKQNFRDAIAAARKEFDVIILDLNPSSSFMIECALSNATHVVCPIRPDKYSVQGLKSLRMLINTAFGLRTPPEILPIFNGVATWDEDFVTRIFEARRQPEMIRKLAREPVVGPQAEAIAQVFVDDDFTGRFISQPIPETPMLKAYQEAKSGGFFRLSRFEKKGNYGAKLASRLMDAAKEIATLTKADVLDDADTQRLAEEA